jgi:uncharacterized protein (TIGR02421 family)
MKSKDKLTAYQKTIKQLSDRLVKAQQPIRLLDAIKWDSEVQASFFKHKFKKLPPVTEEYYQKNPLPFDPVACNETFYDLERDIRRLLGQFNPIGNIMTRMCREYRELVRMIVSRGKPEFSKLSQEIYGSSEDAFFAGDPSLNDLAKMITATLKNIKGQETLSEKDEKRYTSEQAVEILQERMSKYFQSSKRKIRVLLSDGILADASAGADTIKIRQGILFSERDIRVLEVHEGWVHIGTTLNGQAQPICTFLSKGPPSSTVTQEGLATIMELFTFASYPGRVRRLTNRISAISLAEKGANFIDIFNFFREQHFTEEASYANTIRVFRGSTPDGGPFTKDLVYSKGLVLVYNYMQLAIERGTPSQIPLLFAGKVTLSDVHVIADLIDEGLVIPPKFIPRQFTDLAALSAWMCYSNFLTHLNADRVASDYKGLL